MYKIEGVDLKDLFPENIKNALVLVANELEEGEFKDLFKNIIKQYENAEKTVEEYQITFEKKVNEKVKKDIEQAEKGLMMLAEHEKSKIEELISSVTGDLQNEFKLSYQVYKYQSMMNDLLNDKSLDEEAKIKIIETMHRYNIFNNENETIQ